MIEHVTEHVSICTRIGAYKIICTELGAYKIICTDIGAYKNDIKGDEL